MLCSRWNAGANQRANSNRKSITIHCGCPAFLRCLVKLAALVCSIINKHHPQPPVRIHPCRLYSPGVYSGTLYAPGVYSGTLYALREVICTDCSRLFPCSQRRKSGHFTWFLRQGALLEPRMLQCLQRKAVKVHFRVWVSVPRT
jgi:hypothetical protein